MFNEMQLRGLQAVSEEDNLIEDDEPVNIPRRITQRLHWNATQKVLPADDSQIINFYESSDKSYPCNGSKAREFLDKIRMLEDYREDYLDKTIKAHCASQMFGDSSQSSGIVPYYSSSWSLGDSTQYCSGSTSQQKILDRLTQDTTTMMIERPQIILPYDKKGKLRMFDQTSDNQYLHILMPYKDINIINAPGLDTKRDDDLMIEIGCKVFEVNKMYS